MNSDKLIFLLLKCLRVINTGRYIKASTYNSLLFDNLSAIIGNVQLFSCIIYFDSMVLVAFCKSD